LSLPQLTGYILAGIALGPSVGGIISGEVVGEMRMFNTLALGLIATSAGLELDVRQMIRLGKTLIYTTVIKIVVGVSLVGGALFVAEWATGSLGLQTQPEIVTLALVMGVLSIGTSLSIALAVLTPFGVDAVSYAEDIFRLGRELSEVARGRVSPGREVLRVGVVAGLPKTLVHHLLSPALDRLDAGAVQVVQQSLTLLVERW
jgi:hypothetical protein